MIWIAPSENAAATDTLEKRLWDAADQFRANSGLKSQECSGPVLGLAFVCFTEFRESRRDNHLLAGARFDSPLNRPEVKPIGAKVNAAMRDIEKHPLHASCLN